jgi:hypothetical protein
MGMRIHGRGKPRWLLGMKPAWCLVLTMFKLNKVDQIAGNLLGLFRETSSFQKIMTKRKGVLLNTNERTKTLIWKNRKKREKKRYS